MREKIIIDNPDPIAQKGLEETAKNLEATAKKVDADKKLDKKVSDHKAKVGKKEEEMEDFKQIYY